MGQIEAYGFKIFRVMGSPEKKEFILYDIERDRYHCMSLTRIKQILKSYFIQKEISFLQDFIELNKDVSRDIKYIDAIGLALDFETCIVDDIKFKPVNNQIFEEGGSTYFNNYKEPETFNVKKYKCDYSFEDFIKDAPYTYKLFGNLHRYDDNAIKNTLIKIADRIKNPYLKAQDCIVFYPGEGAGKGIFFKYILEPIFGDYAKKVLMKKLLSDHNAFFDEALVLVLEEGKRDLELVETLKDMVTEGKILINPKGVDQKIINTYFLTFVFSNHMNPIDLGKRRGTYHMCKTLGKNEEESQEIGAELCEKLPHETEFLLKYLHSIEFTHQEANKPLKTKAKALVNDLNKNPLELFYDYLIEFSSIQQAITSLENKKVLQTSNVDFEIITHTSKRGKSDEYISKDKIKSIYNIFCEIEGFKSNLIRHNKDIAQLWALMNVSEDAHHRITIKSGRRAGRKVDHIRLSDINTHILEKYKENE